MPELELENKDVLFIVSNSFNETELFHPMRFLENKGCGVTICAETHEPVQNKIMLLPDTTFEKIEPQKFDAVVLVSSKEDLSTKKKLIEKIKQFKEKEILIASIGKPNALIEKFILKDKTEKNSQNIILFKHSQVEDFGKKISEKLIKKEQNQHNQN